MVIVWREYRLGYASVGPLPSVVIDLGEGEFVGTAIAFCPEPKGLERLSVPWPGRPETNPLAGLAVRLHEGRVRA